MRKNKTTMKNTLIFKAVSFKELRKACFLLAPLASQFFMFSQGGAINVTFLYWLTFKMPLVQLGIISCLVVKLSVLWLLASNKVFVSDFMITCYWPWKNVQKVIWRKYNIYFALSKESEILTLVAYVSLQWQISTWNSHKHSSVAKT